METRHARDSDCTLNTSGICSTCHTWHGAPCLECGARAFHKNECAYFEALIGAARLVHLLGRTAGGMKEA
ncbi:MAG: hypothetical protein ACREN5_03400 [Gemmatimonadales bacterium]